MKVLWLSHLVPYPPKGGVLQRAYYLLREASKYHEVDLLAFNQPGLIGPLFNNLEEGLLEAKNNLSEFCRAVEFFSIPSEARRWGKTSLAVKSLFTRDPYNINWLKSKCFDDRLKELIASNSYDVIHFDTLSLVPYLHNIGTIPAVLDHHNIESHMLIRRAINESNFLKKWYFKQEGRRLVCVEKEYCPKFKLNITCSEIDKSRLLKISPSSRVEEVRNGVDVEYFKPCHKEDNVIRLIFAGTLSWYPNEEAVLFIANELWPVIKKEMPDVYFDIVGANPPEAIVRLAEKDSQFIVHGFVDDVRTYLDAASIFICPISDGGGTKLKILDAFSMSKAVVSHPIACEGISVTDGVDVLFAEDVAQYLENIKKLIGEPDYRKSIGDSARRLVIEKYSYTEIGKRLSYLFESCV